MSQPNGVRAWLTWMFAINASAVFFLRHIPARWVLAAVPVNMLAMQLLLRFFGRGHHLSLPHVLLWTPLLIYLYCRRQELLAQPMTRLWLMALFATDAVSLLFDYSSVIHWLLA